MNNGRRCVAIAASLLIAIGCGKGPGDARISGQVTVAGQPMPPGAISFYPAAGGRPIGATVAADGTYDVRLPAGDYRVIVQLSTQLPDGWQEGDPVPPPPVDLARRYTLPASTPLEVSVAEGESATRNFELD